MNEHEKVELLHLIVYFLNFLIDLTLGQRQ